MLVAGGGAGSEPDHTMKTLTLPDVIQLPCVHMNGTGAQTLFDGYLEAYSAVNAAIDQLGKVEFNPRDYYPLGDSAWNLARDQRASLLRAMEAVAENLLAHCEHVQNIISERESRLAARA